MSRISFRVVSVELQDFTFRSINKENLIRISIIQRPSKIRDDYLLKNVECLKDINHEFTISHKSNKVDKLTMTISSVLKKPTLANFFGFDDDASNTKSNDNSEYKIITENKENDNNHIECEYIIPIHSLVGYCTINLKEIKKDVNNSMHIDLITKDDKVIGHANVEVYIWESPKQINQETKSQINGENVLFKDPECPSSNIQPVTV